MNLKRMTRKLNKNKMQN